MIYLDNNATTIMPREARQAMLDWCNKGNPSAGYATAREAQAMMREFREYIGRLCSIDTCSPTQSGDVHLPQTTPIICKPNQYKVIFTSGASEANCTALAACVQAYSSANSHRLLPHIIMSAIEHRSLLDMAASYADRQLAFVTYIKPVRGHILARDVIKAIRPTTCIVCVMHANNETGAIMDIAEIGRAAHNANIPFHCDTVQTFGRFPINPITAHVDSMCVSFHKFGGPPGVGALIIKQQLIDGWHLQPVIFGTQNDGLRGGTENLPGIGAAFAATKIAMMDRVAKNEQIRALKKYIMAEISARIPTRQFAAYRTAESKPSDDYFTVRSGPKPAAEIVFISDDSADYLPNTILLSVIKRTKPAICNGKMKSDLEAKGIIVSVGSACNTASKMASHVISAIGADDLIRAGTLRITLGDLNTPAEIKKFVQEFLIMVKKHINMIDKSDKP